uniref:Carboxylesterase type B domain-containing protein n=1 Tax=Panagrolaimus davidi TaxID=227884 RepID=A0A914Q8P7_9BILA
MEGNKMVEKSEQMSFESFENLYSLNNKKLTKKELQKVVVKMIGDTVSGIALQNFIQQVNDQGSTVYTYNFQHHNSQSMQGISYYLPFSGATHCSEINSLFDINMFVAPYIRTVKDKKVTNIISTLFTNFSKSGNPNGTEAFPSSLNFEFNWEPINSNHISSQKCLLIKSEPKIEERKKETERLLAPSKHFSAIHNWMTIAKEDEYNEFSIRTKAMEPSGTR